MAEFTKNLGTSAAAVASAIGAIVGIKTLVEKHRAAKKAFIDQLATKEQVDRHKQANEEHLRLLQGYMDKRLTMQDTRLSSIEEGMRNIPLEIVKALKGQQ